MLKYAILLNRVCMTMKHDGGELLCNSPISLRAESPSL